MPPALHDGDVVLVPRSCEGWMEPTWIPEVEANGVTVVTGKQTLEEWFDAISEAYGEPPCDPATRTAFAAVGVMRLFAERFARRMHDFDGVDDHRVHDAVRSAAEALVAQNGNGDTTSPEPNLRRLLSPCFDSMLEYRERINPLEPHLMDVVMLADDDGPALPKMLNSLQPADDDAGRFYPDVINLMADRPCWEKLLDAEPDLRDSVRRLWPERQVDLLIGENETCDTRLEPTEIIGERLRETRDWSISTFGRPPRVWARREYGLHPDLPSLLKSAGYEGALHLTFDIGSYPETEDAKATWQSPDRTGLEVFSRLPVPASRAATFWQFPERLAESVEMDAAGAVMFVRWTDAEPWWLQSFRWACSITPLFGQLTTFGTFLTEADGHSRLLNGKPREYFSAALAKRVALKSDDPLQQEVDRWTSYADSIRNRVFTGLSSALTKDVTDDADGLIALAAGIAGTAEQAGTMALNPFPIERSMVVQSGQKRHLLNVPAVGYAWVSDAAKEAQGRSLVEELTLRNEHFEIQISEKTGGLKRLMKYGRRGNFLSQHVARRIESSRDDDYLTVVADDVRVIENTPLTAAIQSTGKLLSDSGEQLATVTQTFQVVRGRPWFDVTVSIDGAPLNEGNPWLSYDAVRFAWATEFSSVSQSCGLCPTGASSDRMESPLFVEIDDDPVVTILTHGRTFHRRQGRTLDMLVGVAGESRRDVRFSVAVGVRDPAAVALAAMTPDDRLTIRTPKPSVESAWLVSIDRRGVVLLAMWSEVDADGESQHLMRIRETNGAASTTTIRLFRRVREVLARDLAGRLTDRLTIRDGAVEVRLREFQMRDLVVKFE